VTGSHEVGGSIPPSSTNLLILNTLTTCPASQFS
jgi:hypothetical protein